MKNIIKFFCILVAVLGSTASFAGHPNCDALRGLQEREVCNKRWVREAAAAASQIVYGIARNTPKSYGDNLIRDMNVKHERIQATCQVVDHDCQYRGYYKMYQEYSVLLRQVEKEMKEKEVWRQRAAEKKYHDKQLQKIPEYNPDDEVGS